MKISYIANAQEGESIVDAIAEHVMQCNKIGGYKGVEVTSDEFRRIKDEFSRGIAGLRELASEDQAEAHSRLMKRICVYPFDGVAYLFETIRVDVAKDDRDAMSVVDYPRQGGSWERHSQNMDFGRRVSFGERTS